jgi:hypothetical protein
LNLGDGSADGFFQGRSLTVEVDPRQSVAAGRGAIVAAGAEQGIGLIVIDSVRPFKKRSNS